MSETNRSAVSTPIEDSEDADDVKPSEDAADLVSPGSSEPEKAIYPSRAGAQPRGEQWRTLQSVSGEQPREKESIERHLSELVRNFATAVNARQFDSSLPPWSDLLDNKFTGLPTKTVRDRVARALNAVEYIEHLQDIVRRHPAYHIEVVQLECFKDPGQGLAIVFQNYDVSGVPPGVTRQSVAIFKLRRNAGNVWRCYNVQSVDGMSGSEGGAGFY